MTSDMMRGILAFIIVVGFLAVIGCIIFFPVKGDNTLLNVLLGALSTVGFSAVISYFFGSSSQSKEKDAVIAASIPPRAP